MAQRYKCVNGDMVPDADGGWVRWADAVDAPEPVVVAAMEPAEAPEPEAPKPAKAKKAPAK